jgi:hypothetical protein
MQRNTLSTAPSPTPQHAAPAVDIREALTGGAGGPGPGPSGGLLQQLGLASLGARVEQRLASLGLRLPGPRGGAAEDPLEPFMGGCGQPHRRVWERDSRRFPCIACRWKLSGVESSCAAP